MSRPAAQRSIADVTAAQRLFANLAEQRAEIAAIAYVDADWRLLGMRHGAGRIDWVDMPPCTVARDALAFGAAGVLIAHNHPAGDPSPSAGDLAYTRLLARGLAAVGIILFDHLIFAAGGHVSLCTAGMV